MTADRQLYTLVLTKNGERFALMFADDMWRQAVIECGRLAEHEELNFNYCDAAILIARIYKERFVGGDGYR